LLDTLLEGCPSEEDLFGPEGVFTKLKGAVMERLLEAEMSEHLGHTPQGRRRGSNTRNGHSRKTVQTESGPVEIQVPRDREGSFEPQLVKKHQRRLEGFDEKAIALYARGMTTGDIQQHLRELYGTEVSPELISRATEGVLEEFRAWQTRPLESVYPEADRRQADCEKEQLMYRILELWPKVATIAARVREHWLSHGLLVSPQIGRDSGAEAHAAEGIPEAYEASR
jgi:transposase-like protein